jgi:hypothetical protein
MYEVVWDTTKFNNKADWPADGSHPFYLSTGDHTGLGQHADYVFGWKGDSLQKAMDTAGCMGAKCGTLKTQSIDVAKQCTVKNLVKEDNDACKCFRPNYKDLARITDTLHNRARQAPW